MLGHYVFVVFATAQQSTVHERVKCLHTAIHNFRKTGNVRNVFYFEAGITQCFRCAACGNNFRTKLCKCLGKFDHASFVGDADKSS